MVLRFNPFKSMTIQGAVAAVTPYVINAFDVAALDPKLSAGISVLGLLWSVIGARNAVEKAAGAAVAELTERLLRRAGGAT